MDEPNLVGGSESDRKSILQQHHAYLEANTDFDWEKLQGIWSGAPEATFFNLNGHTYNGRDHWTRLWKFYKQNVDSSFWTPYDISGVVSGDMAVVWCHRRTRRRWVGKEPPPEVVVDYANAEFVSRSTLVFRKEEGEWRVVHAHFSPASSAARPGGV
jgi:ketosteroid isomerase-like protein